MPNSATTKIDSCSARQLKELLGLAMRPVSTSSHRLLAVAERENLEVLLTEMCSFHVQSGTDLLQSVCSPDSSVEVLMTVKDLAKRLATTAQDKRHRAAATLLYHLSVASALGYHAASISKNSPLGRLALYEELAADLGDELLAAVFDAAVEHLSGRP